MKLFNCALRRKPGLGECCCLMPGWTDDFAPREKKEEQKDARKRKQLEFRREQQTRHFSRRVDR